MWKSNSIYFLENNNLFRPVTYICVIDFEATCIKSEARFYPHEIIEFPAVLLDASKCKIVDTFHSFVKPLINPVLSEFCKDLTGITQDSINNAETFDVVFAKFIKWINSILSENTDFAVMTDGLWDVTKFLYLQCLISHLDFPDWAENFIDIKDIYKDYNGKKEKPKLMTMLHTYGLEFKGRLHSGKDDAFNIANLALKMLRSGCKFYRNTGVINNRKIYFQNSLATYLKHQRKNRKRYKKNSQQKNDQAVDSLVMCNYGQMDIDPDIACESILLQHKSK